MGCGSSKGKNVVEDAASEEGFTVTDPSEQQSSGRLRQNGTPMPEAALKNMMWPEVPSPMSSPKDRKLLADDGENESAQSTPLEPVAETEHDSKPTIEEDTDDIKERMKSDMENEMEEGPVFVEILTIEISEIPVQEDPSSLYFTKDSKAYDNLQNGEGEESKGAVIESVVDETENDVQPENKNSEEVASLTEAPTEEVEPVVLEESPTKEESAATVEEEQTEKEEEDAEKNKTNGS